jgi:DNA-binding XRE family transcriptional regulator/quercetin dioxygenase-like cupin family protein
MGAFRTVSPVAEPEPTIEDELLEPSHIGPRLRAERERQGLSVRELARRVGVSASLVSQIERDKVTPSVSTLWALVRELNMSMGELFDDDDAPPSELRALLAPGMGPVWASDRRVIQLASGVTWERLTAGSQPGVEFLRLVYEAGSESCPEDSLIRHTGKEYGHVLSGRLGVQVGFDTYDLGPGDSLSFDGSLPHRLWAIGDEPAEAIWAVVGRQGDASPP